MSSSAQNSYFFLNLQNEAPSPLTPGSDTSTLFEFIIDPTPSPLRFNKAAPLASPTETLADHQAQSELSSRRLDYLERIEKVLSTELNPFDLLARSHPKQSPFEQANRDSPATGARFVDAVPDTRVDMQNPGSHAPNHPNASAPADNAQHAAFYDPSSADGYSAPSQSSLLSAAPAFGSQAGSAASGMQLGAPNAFRDNAVNPSPLSSPHLGAVSPAASHHRIGSHSSEAASPPCFAQGFIQTLPSHRPLVKSCRSTSDASASAPFGSMSTQPYGGQSASSTPQLTLGIPTLSVSSASMDYTPVATNADANMPISMSWPLLPPRRERWVPTDKLAGFKTFLHSSLPPLRALPPVSMRLRPKLAPRTTGCHPTRRRQYTTNLSAMLMLPGLLLSLNSLPRRYCRLPARMSSVLTPRAAALSRRLHSRADTDDFDTGWKPATQSGRPRSWSVVEPGQATRFFLRLDVDMGFQSNGKTESPTLASFRKRANSDVGPRSPVVAGNAGGDGTAFDWSFAATDQAGERHKEVDWSSFKGDSTGLTDSSLQIDPSQLATMDPSLLNNSQISVDMSHAFGNNHALLSSLQQQQLQFQQQQQHFAQQQQSQSQQQQMMPPVFQLNGQTNIMGAVDFSSQPAGAGSNEFNPGWRFPGDGTQHGSADGAAGGPKLRRSNSARQSSSAGHRRLAHSEDLSRSRMYQGADEDFLAQITAPNGGLAPPSTGRSVSSNNAATGSHHHTMSGSARVHPYRTGHDRHYSFGSNTSNSSAGSASPLPQMGGGLIYDAAGNLVQYPSDAFGSMAGMGMDGAAPSPSASSVASGTSSQSMLAPPVPVVTSQATQAASASRRKSEALFACPIPGCGSTFTRQYNLRGHLRSHADERPYKCDWPGCDKSFARSHDCKRHQNLHLNIKPHTCEQCGKTFARLDALNRHHKSDTGGCTMRSDGESQSNSTDASSLSGGADATGSQAGSDYGSSQNWSAGVAMAGGNSVGSSQTNKTFGGHVL
ncbi:uncharacterized protein UTRI_02487 [Ustilago trichophora]|uniref:C2H2-type domain-containing protein n=1 Tax=Ustilago trichophora TaxID=86804 RepID=A0A5C3E9F5_9BASI|nr:uncharacterized protein UTRI_02487 [Ustilago trichophora]